jgi:hypothetical protein
MVELLVLENPAKTDAETSKQAVTARSRRMYHRRQRKRAVNDI